MKGVLKSFEAIVAILAIVTTFFLLFGKVESFPELEIAIWKMRGHAALEALDRKEELATFALANDTEAIKARLSPLLPIGINYEVVICENSCPIFKASSEKITSVSYFVAGNGSILKAREIVLYLWR